MSLLPCYSVEARVEHVLMSPGGMRRGGGGGVRLDHSDYWSKGRG